MFGFRFTTLHGASVGALSLALAASFTFLGGAPAAHAAVTAFELEHHPRLNIAYDRPNGVAILTWPDDPLLSLEEGPTVFGPWNPVPNAISPFAVPLTDQRQFFRLSPQPEPPTLELYPDQIAIVAAEGVSLDDLNQAAAQHGLEPASLQPIGGAVYRVPWAADPQEILQLAAVLKEDFPQLISVAGVPVVPEGSDNPMVMTDELIVQFRQDAKPEEIDALNTSVAAAVLLLNPFHPNQYLLKLDPAGPDALQMSRLYAENSLVEYSEPNYGLYVDYRATIPNDTLFNLQWHLNNTGQSGGTPDADIDAAEAWDITMGSSSVPIAVIDEGFDAAHPDLAPNLWINSREIPGNGVDDDRNSFVDDINGWDFLGNDNTLSGGPHGTAAAGCAAARGNNLLGVTGSCPRGRLMLLRNGLTAMNSALAFDYARGMGAGIISCSWGYRPGTAVPVSVSAAINRAATTGRAGLGCVIFFAQNNADRDDCAGPTPDISALPNVIAVSAASNQDRKVTESGWGNCMDLLGPTHRGYGRVPFTGTLNVTTTDISGSAGYNNSLTPSSPCITESANRDYTFCFGGTSAATPIVAGASGLVLAVNPSLTRVQVQRLFQDTADKIQDSAGSYSPRTGYSTPASGIATHGYGRVNAFEAVRVAAPVAQGGRGGVDVFVRDNYLDWGNTEKPSNVLFEPVRGYNPHWRSLDIKVDAPPFTATPPTTSAQFDAFAHENPIAETVNRVYVRVHNRGPVPADTVRVKLHWVFAGTALPALPPDFWSRFPSDSSDTSVWHPMGTVTLRNLSYSGASVAGGPSDRSQVATFDFPAPAIDPSAAKPRHYCLFAVIDSPQDPVSATSRGSLIPDFITPRDNNVTHRNVALQDPSARSREWIFIRNPFDYPVMTLLRWEGSDNWGVELQGLPLNAPIMLDAAMEIPVELDIFPPGPDAKGTITLIQEEFGANTTQVMGGFTFEYR